MDGVIIICIVCPILVLHPDTGNHRCIIPAPGTAVSLYGPGQGSHIVRVIGVPVIHSRRLQRRVEPAHKLIRRKDILCAGCLGRSPVLLVCIGHFRHFLQIRAELPVKCFLVVILFLRRHQPCGIQVHAPHPLFLANAPAFLLPYGMELPAPVHILPGILIGFVPSPLHSRHKGALRDAYHTDDKQDHQNQECPRLSQSDGEKGGKNTPKPSSPRTGQCGLFVVLHPLCAGRHCSKSQLQQSADRNHSPHHGRQLHGGMDVALVGQMKTGPHKYQDGKQVSHHSEHSQLHTAEHIAHHAAQLKIAEK